MLLFLLEINKFRGCVRFGRGTVISCRMFQLFHVLITRFFIISNDAFCGYSMTIQRYEVIVTTNSLSTVSHCLRIARRINMLVSYLSHSNIYLAKHSMWIR